MVSIQTNQNVKISDTIPFKGEFSISCLDKNGNVIDTFTERNLVVNLARKSMAYLIAGNAKGLPINGFKIGTLGHNTETNNILEPKLVGSDGYDELREELFSVESGGNNFYYCIKWDENFNDADGNPQEFTDDKIEFVATGQKKAQDGTETDAENAPCPVKIQLSETFVLFSFEIGDAYANGMDGVSVVAFTEAGMYCGDRLFTIKCFNAKVKENTVKFVINWKIIF